MMSEYNRTNPFMYLLKESEKELELSSQSVIQHFIYCTIGGIIGLVLSIVCWCMTCDMVYGLLPITIVGTWVFTGYHIQKTFFVNRHQEINEMLLGDKFENINLNNEKLLEDIVTLKKATGFMNGLYESITRLYIVYGLFIVIAIIRIFTIIFAR